MARKLREGAVMAIVRPSSASVRKIDIYLSIVSQSVSNNEEERENGL